MEAYYDKVTALWGLKCRGSLLTDAMFLEVMDIRDERAAVRYDNGAVGVLDAGGRTVMRLPEFQRVEFAGSDFLRVANGQDFLIDMRSGEFFAYMPEIRRIGNFELLYIGNYIYTRTRKRYGVRETANIPHLSRNGTYLTLPCDVLPAKGDCGVRFDVGRWITDTVRAVCLLAGDDSQAYWKYRTFDDGSLVVIDDDGRFYRVTFRRGSDGKPFAVKTGVEHGAMP